MPQEAINQIRNPSFELYIDPTTLLPFSGWQITRRSGGSNTTTTDISAYIVNTKAWAGINSVYTANVVGSDFVTLRYDSLSIETGKYYAFSFYVYGAPRSSGRLYTATVSSGGVARGRKAFNIIENQWQRIEVVFYSSVTSSSVSASIGKEIVGSSYAGGDVYIDAVQFEQLNTVDADIGLPTPANMHATTYFDGDTVGYIDDSTGIIEYAWDARPHWSESRRSSATASGGRIYNLQDEFGFNVVGVAEAGINQPQVQAIAFNSQDGGSLQDIINPVRTITFIGQIYGQDKIDLSRKLQRLQALLSRDLVAQRQVRRFIFQHKDGFENVGVPMSFSGAFVGGLNVMATNTLVVDIDISIQMSDPYFYGHDEGMELLGPDEYLPTAYVNKISSYNTASQTAVLNQISINANNIWTLAQAPDGRIWIGGDFTIATHGTPSSYICIYNPRTNALEAVPGGTLNSEVFHILFSPDGLAWIAGNFTGAMGNYLTTHNGTAYVSTGNFNAAVQNLAIVPLSGSYEVYAVGSFTSAPSVATALRIARRTTAGVWTAYTSGFGSIVYAITYDAQRDILYVGGQFTTPTARVAQIARSTGTITACGSGIANNVVLCLYVDADGTLVIGGTFTSPSTYAAYFANGTISGWPIGYATTPLDFPTRNHIWGYKGGIVIGAPRAIASTTVSVPAYRTDLPALAYWNGTALGGSAWIPIGDCRPSGQIGARFTGIELSNGDVYVGVANLTALGAQVNSARITHAINTSTVQAYPIIRMQFDNQPFDYNIQVNSIINCRDNKNLLFNDRMETNTGLTADIDLDFVKGDLVYVKPQYSKISSAYFDNLIRVINPAGTFADFTLRPGSVDLALVSFNTGIAVYWPQTFQSIFDGVYKS
jgi:hypothetical protein